MININSNILSLKAQRALGDVSNSLSNIFQRLSSGSRINKASDDTASMAIADSLKLNARVYTQGIRNINDGISLSSIADSALSNLKTIVMRAKELAEQSANGTFSDTQRSALQAEVTTLEAEFNRIVSTSTFNGINVFSRSDNGFVLQAGFGSNATLALNFQGSRQGTIDSMINASVSSSGAFGDASSSVQSVSDDGRYIAYVSSATNLVSGDTNGVQDIFVFDRVTGITQRVSVDSAGNQSNGVSNSAMISGDGRYVCYQSSATNLVSGDTNGTQDIFVFDRVTGVTERVSVDSSGTQSNGLSAGAAISSDGRYVTYASVGTNLVSGDTNALSDVFVYDRTTDTTKRVSVDSLGAQASGGASIAPTISADGRYITYSSLATNLVTGDTNGTTDIFLYDQVTATTQRISVSSSGTEGNGASAVPIISANGQYVTYLSSATNLVTGDTNTMQDAFVYNTSTGTTERVLGTNGVQGNFSTTTSSISGDGRYVVISSQADNLVSGDTNAQTDIFLYDRTLGTMERINLSPTGVQADGSSGTAKISADGQFITFASGATNMVNGDSNGVNDIFVRANSAYTSSLTKFMWVDVKTQANALTALPWLDDYLDELSTAQGQIGAAQSRMAIATSNLQSITENTVAARSRLVDADVASEAALLVRDSIRRDVTSAILAQANQLQGLALTLLKPPV